MKIPIAELYLGMQLTLGHAILYKESNNLVIFTLIKTYVLCKLLIIIIITTV